MTNSSLAYLNGPFDVAADLLCPSGAAACTLGIVLFGPVTVALLLILPLITTAAFAVSAEHVAFRLAVTFPWATSVAIASVKPVLAVGHGVLLLTVFAHRTTDVGTYVYDALSSVSWAVACSIIARHWRRGCAPLPDTFLLWIATATAADLCIAVSEVGRLPILGALPLASTILSLPLGFVCTGMLLHSGRPQRRRRSCLPVCSSCRRSIDDTSPIMPTSLDLMYGTGSTTTEPYAHPASDPRPTRDAQAGDGQAALPAAAATLTASAAPSDIANFFSRATFSWAGPALSAGRRGTLAEELPPLPWLERSATVAACLNAAALDFYRAAPLSDSDDSVGVRRGGAKFWHAIGAYFAGLIRSSVARRQAAAAARIDENATVSSIALRTPLANLLAAAFGSDFLAGAVLRATSDVMQYASASLLHVLVRYLADLACCTDERPSHAWQAVVLCFLMAALAILHTAFMHQHHVRILRAGQHVRSSVALLIRAKLERLPTPLRRIHARNAAQFDAEGRLLQELPVHAVTLLVSTPLQIMLACTLLYSQLGASMTAGLSILVLFLPANSGLAAASMRARQRVATVRAQRATAWRAAIAASKNREPESIAAFDDARRELGAARSAELAALQRLLLLLQLEDALWISLPLLVSLASLACYGLLHAGAPPAAPNMFTAIALFNLLRFPLVAAPGAIHRSVKAIHVTCNVEAFLCVSEYAVEQLPEMKRRRSAAQIRAPATPPSPVWPRSTPRVLPHRSLPPGAIVQLSSITRTPSAASVCMEPGSLGKDCAREADERCSARGKQAPPLASLTPLAMQRLQQVSSDTQMATLGTSRQLFRSPSSKLHRSAKIYAQRRRLLSDIAGADASQVPPRGALRLLSPPLVVRSVLEGMYSGFEGGGSASPVLRQKRHAAVTRHRRCLGSGARLSFSSISSDNARDDDSSSDGIENDSDDDVNDSADFGDATAAEIDPSPALRGMGRGARCCAALHAYASAVVGRCAGPAIALTIFLLFVCYQISAMLTTAFLSAWEQRGQARHVQGLLVYCGLTLVTLVLLLVSRGALALAGVGAARALFDRRSAALLAFASTPCATPDSVIGVHGTDAASRLPEARGTRPSSTRLLQDTEVVDEALPRGLAVLLSALLPVAAAVVIVAVVTPWALLVTPLLAGVMWWGQRFYLPTMRQLEGIESSAHHTLLAALRAPPAVDAHPNASSASLSSVQSSDEAAAPPLPVALDAYQRAVYVRTSAARWLGVHVEAVGALFLLAAALCGVLMQGVGEVARPPLLGASLSVALAVTPMLSWVIRMLSELEGLALAVPVAGKRGK
jgi:hypothetical protein